MEDRVTQFRLGVFVVLVLTVIMMLSLVFLFGELPSAGQKILYVRFDNAPGAAVETPVRKNGILIGRVRSEPELVDDGVLLTIAIDPSRTIRENEICRLSSDNLFGDAVLEFISSSEGPKGRELQHGDFLRGAVANNPMDALRVVANMEEKLNDALTSIQTAGEEVGNVAESMNAVVANNHGRFDRILGKTESALGQFDTVMTALNQVVTDDDLNVSISEALEGVPQLFNDAAQLMQGLNRVSDEAEKNLIALRGLTEPLGEQGNAIVNKLSSSAGRLDELLMELQVFAETLNGSDGTVGKLVNDPQIYQNLNRIAENVEQLTRDLRPIIADARVAVDKIARNPGRVGIPGLLERRSSGIK